MDSLNSARAGCSGFGAEARGERGGRDGRRVRQRESLDQHSWLRARAPRRHVGTGAVLGVVIGVDRTGALAPGARMGAFTSQARLGGRSLLEVEGAMSDSAGVGRRGASRAPVGRILEVELRREPRRAGRPTSPVATTGRRPDTQDSRATLRLGHRSRQHEHVELHPDVRRPGLSAVSRSTTSREASFTIDSASSTKQMTRRDSGTFADARRRPARARVRANIPARAGSICSPTSPEGTAHSRRNARGRSLRVDRR